MRFLLLALVLLCLITSCSDKESLYRRTINEIPIERSLISHFPRDIDKSNKFSFYFNFKPILDKFTSKVVFVYLEVEGENIDSLVYSFSKRKIASYSFFDDCNLIVNKFQKNTSYSSYIGKEWLYENWLEEKNDCLKSKFPIPNFIGIGQGKMKDVIGLSDDYEIYVLESKSGKYFDESYYSKPILMPKTWERGFSKGVAINQSLGKVLYWSVVW